MLDSLRSSLTWLHTWSGLLIGSLLFTIFWMGTLSVFDREIDRWMMPETRILMPDSYISMDDIRDAAADFVPADSSRWQFLMPSEREPIIRMYYQGPEIFHRVHLDPNTMEVVEGGETLGATGFFFPFHFSLMLRWNSIGYWLVGLAAMAMMMLLVSGVIIHKKIFIDFFTFRAEKKLSRSSLDLHNVMGVLGLPFHIMITLSGLIIFMSIYLPGVMERTYSGDSSNFTNEAFGDFVQQVANEPGGELVSFETLRAQAEAIWNGSEVYYARIWNQSDANATIEMRRNRDDAVPLNLDLVSFDGDSGEIYTVHESEPVMAAQRWIAGFHFIQFDHWTLRWVYFLLGLAGCALIGSGFVIWFETRRKQHELEGKSGVRIVESLAIASITGIIIATLAFLIANRLLPADAHLMGQSRSDLELWIFFLSWIATAAHAGMRSAPKTNAWVEQCGTIAAFSVVAVLLNWITTGDHLLSAFSDGLWAVAGIDLVLLANALLAYAVMRRLAQTRASKISPTEASPCQEIDQIGTEVGI